jgi:hypothetical protein
MFLAAHGMGKDYVRFVHAGGMNNAVTSGGTWGRHG